MILAGDIGGTNTRLAVFDDKLKIIGKPLKFPTGNGKSFEANVLKVLKKNKSIDRACFAVAGPVMDGQVTMTNVGRSFDQASLSRALKIPKVSLINDLVANASGIELLNKKELQTLVKGESHVGNRAVVSPGTGLGVGGLIWDGTYHRPSPTEGGHAHFSPPDELSAELWLYLNEVHPTVTWEHILSGTGIENIYDFFVEIGGDTDAKTARLLSKAKPGQRAAIISQAGLQEACEACSATMELFAKLLATECQNIAVLYFAVGGLFIGGGIPPKVLPILKKKDFRKAFLTHKTMGHLLAKVPVHVILNDDTALEGAALYGKRFG